MYRRGQSSTLAVTGNELHVLDAAALDSR
jgi:hypothetical protein